MKRSGPLRRKTPLRSTSSLKRSALKGGRIPRRARPDEPLSTWCEARTDVCEGRAVHRHHKRGRVGVDADAREHTIDVCDACHRHIHAHPTESYQRGWMERRT